MHLRILNAAPRESGLLELPVEMSATIFKHMAESDFVVWIPKVIEDRMSNCHVYQVSQTVEIRRRTYNDSARPQNPLETLQYDMTRDWKVFNDFGEKDEVELGDKGRLRFT
jgi:hypothetical protein